MTQRRLPLLDALRGIALLAMGIYHLSWDLLWFGVVDWPVDTGMGWRAFAAAIAATFLFLAGVSLSLAHGGGIRWRPFWRRLLVIVAAAAAVSAGTWYVLGDGMVRFGILHAIAASSLVALPFTRLHPAAAALAGAGVLALPALAAGPAFDGPLWLWTGLGDPGVASVDYVPLAPWTGATLLGVAAGLLLQRARPLMMLARRWQPGSRAGRLGVLAGRHSLAVYLLHQPVLFGSLWLLAAVHLIPDRASTDFLDNCSLTCAVSGVDEADCRAICRCTLTAMQADGLWSNLLRDPDNLSLREDMNLRHQTCVLGETRPAQGQTPAR
ncbi:DUF1624 domain-containing protein [Microvirga tunisiensis]|uniref:DUF1624 domain-containing protein n=1 Tax=Pannonibacter tanglangensis TaxID=2750084 RepID=A0A7X5EZM8_9HYPH|nr:heparan-alpha-glucosaminide N-acetyltransferase [Pannonibacter sp. XCT-53]NBN77061.1 DUF1624 domain-containing protein [Pannonibacter sp. XCT-53]